MIYLHLEVLFFWRLCVGLIVIHLINQHIVINPIKHFHWLTVLIMAHKKLAAIFENRKKLLHTKPRKICHNLLRMSLTKALSESLHSRLPTLLKSIAAKFLQSFDWRFRSIQFTFLSCWITATSFALLCVASWHTANHLHVECLGFLSFPLTFSLYFGLGMLL